MPNTIPNIRRTRYFELGEGPVFTQTNKPLPHHFRKTVMQNYNQQTHNSKDNSIDWHK